MHCEMIAEELLHLAYVLDDSHSMIKLTIIIYL